MKTDKCFDCGNDVPDGIFRCERCVNAITRSQKERRRQGMTEWEQMKIGFYKSEKKWEENIRSRQMKVIDGKPTPFYQKNGQLIPLPTAKKQYDGSYR